MRTRLIRLYCWLTLQAIGLALGVALLLLGGAAWVVWEMRRPLITRALTNLMRTQLEYKITALNLWEDFPHIRLSIHDVRLHNTNPYQQGVPMRMDSVAFHVNLYKVLLKPEHKTVEKIAIRGLHGDMGADTNGIGNLNIFNFYEDDRDVPRLVEIEQLLVTEAHFNFYYRPTGSVYDIMLDSVRMAINVKPHSVMFQEAQVWGRSNYIQEGNLRFLENRPLNINSRFRINKPGRTLFVSDMAMELDSNLVKVRGLYPLSRDRYFDLEFDIPNGDVRPLLSLMPVEAVSQLRSYRPTGDFTFQGQLVGRDTRVKNPHFQLDFTCRNGGFYVPLSESRVSGLAFSGVFSNGEANSSQTTYLRVRDLAGRLDGRPFQASFRLSEFNDLKIDAQVRSKLDAQTIARTLSMNPQAGTQGYLDLNIKTQGRLRDLRKLRTANRLSYEGGLAFQDFGIHPGNTPFKSSGWQGNVSFSNKRLHLDSLAGRINEQRFQITGQVNALVDYLAGDYNDFEGDFVMTIDTLNIDTFSNHIRSYLDSADVSLQVRDTTGQRRHWLDFDPPNGLDLGFKLDAQKLVYRDMLFDSLKILGGYRNKRLLLPLLHIGGQQSELQMDLTLDGRQHEQNRLYGQLNAQTRDLTGLLGRLGLGSPAMDTLRISTGGQLHFEGRLRKNLAHTQAPPMDLRLRLANGYAQEADMNIKLTDLTTTMQLDEGHLLRPKQRSFLVDTIRGRANGYPFAGRFHLKDLQSQAARLQLASSIALPAFFDYFKIENVTEPAGFMNFTVDMHGRLPNFLTPDSLVYIESEGHIRLSELAGTFPQRNLRLRNVNGRIDFGDYGARIAYLQGKAGRSDLWLTGTMQEALPFLFLENKALQADVSAFADTLDLDELLAVSPPAGDTAGPAAAQPPPNKPARRQDTAGGDEYFFKVPFDSDIQLQANVGHTRVARFRADSVYLRSSLVGRQLDLRHLTGRYADGEVSLLGRLDASNRDSMIASVDADLEGVKVNRFLYTFQDFNQALLTHEQVRGRLSGQLSYRDVLPPDFKPSFQHTLASLHNLRIQDGVLWNFEPLQRLSPFIQPEYTDTVDFDLSAPYMYWRDEALQVPQIQLRSSILNAIIQGRHRLDSQIDYTLMVSPVRQNYPIFETRLRDLFFGPPHESLLNFRITGHAQDYKIHYDFERSSQNFLEKLFR